MQQKTDNLAQETSKTGLQINLEKTETMTLLKKQEKPIKVEENGLKEVTYFTYLDTIVSVIGGSYEDIKARLGKTRHAFITLSHVWSSTAFSVPINKEKDQRQR